MTKGIVVLDDMPDKCNNCILFRKNDDYGCYCDKSKKFITDKESIPEWCEIKPVPEYRPEAIVYGDCAMTSGALSSTVRSTGRINKENIGFNECLDEILGR